MVTRARHMRRGRHLLTKSITIGGDTDPEAGRRYANYDTPAVDVDFIIFPAEQLGDLFKSETIFE